jgi:thiamine biosynthesis lipoprotein
MDRREFIHRIGLMGSGIVAGNLLTTLPVQGWKPAGSGLFRLSETRLKLGTSFGVTLIHHTRNIASEVIESVFTEVDRLGDILSRHQEGSPVWLLNNRGNLEDAPRELMDLIIQSRSWNQRTGGFFDITVEPIVTFFTEHFNSYRTPPPEEKVLGLLERMGFEKVNVGISGISFKHEGMGITLDGIAKGYIIDRSMAVIESRGIKGALINAGGDIRAMGGKVTGSPWRIAIQDPWESEGTTGTIDLVNGAVATSGNYRIYHDEEKLFHHIIDPFSGRSPRMTASTTILSRSTLEADALSTALFIMKPERARNFAERLPGTEGLILTRDGKKLSTSGWRL